MMGRKDPWERKVEESPTEILMEVRKIIVAQKKALDLGRTLIVGTKKFPVNGKKASEWAAHGIAQIDQELLKRKRGDC